MNLAIRNSLSGMLASASRLESGIKDNFDNVVELNDALESIREARATGIAIMSFLDDLEFAKNSLERNGYSDQWFDTMNSDGNFLDAINVDITALIGTDKEKCDVCTEGILSTIWSVIKRIWDWIWDLIGKCITFLKRFMGILTSDKRGVDKCVQLFSVCTGAEDPEEVCKKIGEIINTAGERGSKYYDLRNLVERAEVDRCVLSWIVKNYQKSFGCNLAAASSANDGSNMFDTAFVEYAAKHAVNDKNAVSNPVLRDLFDAVENDPSAIGETNKLSGFSGFSAVIGASGLKAQMARTGVEIIKSGNGEIAVQTKEFPDAIKEVDYTSTYTDIKNYDVVFRIVNKIMEMWSKNDQIFSSQMTSLRSWAKYASDLTKMFQNKNVDRSDPNYSDHVRMTNAFQWESRWMMETVGLMQKFINDYFKASAAIRKVVQAVYHAYPEIEKLIKEQKQN